MFQERTRSVNTCSASASWKRQLASCRSRSRRFSTAPKRFFLFRETQGPCGPSEPAGAAKQSSK